MSCLKYVVKEEEQEGCGQVDHGECIPVTAIPHTTKLYSEYLFHPEKVKKFYPHGRSVSAVASYARSLQMPQERREAVANALDRQNREFGSDTSALESIERLRNGAVAVVSGQQVGFCGGPLYSILKAASAIELASSLTRLGIDAVPVFWLATEDHDLAEIDHTSVLEADGLLRTFAASVSVSGEPPVGVVKLGRGAEEAVAKLAGLLPDGYVREALVSSYTAEETFGSAFAKLFAKLFTGRGLVLLDPLDSELHSICAPLLAEAIARSGELDQALLSRGEELTKHGYHQQVRVTAESTLLFSLAGGERKVIHKAGDDFLIGAKRVAREELLQRVQQAPEEFSPNVLLRPLMQDFLLPTAAYFGGAAEVAYFAQVDVVYQKLLGRTTPVLPRLALTLMDDESERALNEYSIIFGDSLDVFAHPERLVEQVAAEKIPAWLKRDIDTAAEDLHKSLERIKKGLNDLDPTLIDAAERSGRKMKYQLSKIRRKAGRAVLRCNPELENEAARLAAALFPHKVLQERTIAGVYFLAVYGPALLDRMIALAGTHCPGHHIMHVEARVESQV